MHGDQYTYNLSAVIDWGTFINAIISFLIIAATLFVILKVFAALNAKRDAMKAAALEKYYEAHPEERPAPPDPVKPQPTEQELLTAILEELKKQNAPALEGSSRTRIATVSSISGLLGRQAFGKAFSRGRASRCSFSPRSRVRYTP